MITHEEIIEISKHYNLNINQSSTIERYVKQNQLREERAKKVEELLGFFQEREKLVMVMPNFGRTLAVQALNNIIKRKEKELEELK